MLRYGASFSCCARRTMTMGHAASACSIGAGPSTHASHCFAGTTTTTTTVQGALLTPVRWRASVIRIANRKRVEMFVGKRYHLPTRLRGAAPDVAMEWDYDKNPMHLYPEIVSIGYMYPVHWKCRKCDHAYSMSVEKRVVRGGGCPACEDREQSVSMAHNTAAMGVGGAEAVHDNADDVDGGASHHLGEPAPLLLPGEENRSLRPKRPTMLNLRTKY
ncbi:hypothetical protein NESM_000562000 [Novymonas esmeraldas]|uniref:Treble clef zinc finger domain-containing protein n=1 Tax=Novymonas esmeraldas TaxID=1808958 RepID=A0AAW0EU44_9TRYP